MAPPFAVKPDGAERVVTSEDELSVLEAELSSDFAHAVTRTKMKNIETKYDSKFLIFPLLKNVDVYDLDKVKVTNFSKQIDE